MDTNPDSTGENKPLRRIGGELPAFVDRLTNSTQWQPNWLTFSHGRAALAWLIERHGIRSASVCAYTCPTVPAFFQRRGINVRAFDVGVSWDELIGVSAAMQPPRLVLLPALFGSPPWLDPVDVQAGLGSDDHLVIDAAQTAFGHRDFRVPPKGAVLSCPRKSTELPDGAVLSVGEELAGAVCFEQLPTAVVPSALKSAARALWALDDPGVEAQAMRYSGQSEKMWSDTPQRMTDRSRALLKQLDVEWHASVRRNNRDTLISALRSRVPHWPSATGTPFSLPVFVTNRDAVLSSLRDQRIFATALWPDAQHDPRRHRVAGWLAQHLISLPIDQRHGGDDMERLATAFRRSGAQPAAPSHCIARSLHL